MTAQQICHIFHSTLTRYGWEVREGGETVSRHPNQQACEAAAIACARQVNDEGGLAASGPARQRRHCPPAKILRRAWEPIPGGAEGS